jgi:uncharacterized phage-associated protein
VISVARIPTAREDAMAKSLLLANVLYIMALGSQEEVMTANRNEDLANLVNYITCILGPISFERLQMFCYYCQAWSLVWDEGLLFDAEFTVDTDGFPSCSQLYQLYDIDDAYENQGWTLSHSREETAKVVVEMYGAYTTDELKSRAAGEPPCLHARVHYKSPGIDNVVSHVEMRDYYSSLHI